MEDGKPTSQAGCPTTTPGAAGLGKTASTTAKKAKNIKSNEIKNNVNNKNISNKKTKTAEVKATTLRNATTKGKKQQMQRLADSDMEAGEMPPPQSYSLKIGRREEEE